MLLDADLVFIQNGMLQPWLDERGLGDNTQACPWYPSGVRVPFTDCSFNLRPTRRCRV